MQTRQVKAPISAHPLFPAVVAVWFAALFGLGSGVLPNVLFERLIEVSGLSWLMPAAAPPLGVTFRILLSLGFGLAGAGAGFVLARRLAAAQFVDRPASAVSRLAPRPDPRPSIDARRRPISVKEELGNTRLDPVDHDEAAPAAAPLPGRRRALAMAEDERKSDFFTHAPVSRPEPSPQEPPMEQPLDLTSFAAPEPEPAQQPTYAQQVEPRVEDESIVDRGLHGLRNRSPFAKPLGDETAPAAASEAPAFAEPAPSAASVAPPAPIDDEPLPFAAPSLAARPEPLQSVEPPAPPVQPVAQPAAPEPQVFAAAAAVADPVLPTDPEAELSDLGMVQLAERLAASLRKRLTRPAAPPAFVEALKADFGIAESEPVEIAPGSAIFGGAGFEPVAPNAAPPPPVIPEALRPLPPELAGDDDDSDSHIPSLSLPLGNAATAAAFGAPDADEDEGLEEIGEAEQNYSSLLAMNNPFRAPTEFVRVAEPEPEDGAIEPAVVFPGEAPQASAPAPFAAPGAAPAQATPAAVPEAPEPLKPEGRPFDAPANAAAERRKPDPEETERALRSALSTLQKMSGAA